MLGLDGAWCNCRPAARIGIVAWFTAACLSMLGFRANDGEMSESKGGGWMGYTIEDAIVQHGLPWCLESTVRL